MTQIANQNAPSTPLPSAWIERLFERLSAFYGAKFLDMWRELDLHSVKAAWAEELAGYTAAELKCGLAQCKTSAWPPTLPEFMTWCRPTRDTKALWAEACEQMRIRLQGRGEDRWSHPRVYWAAVAIGAHDLNLLGWEQIRARWETALGQAKTDGIPEYRAALPAPGKTQLNREEARARLAELRKAAGLQAPREDSNCGNKDWALRLLDREYRGETLQPIQTQMAREALGFESALPIADVMANLGNIQQEAA